LIQYYWCDTNVSWSILRFVKEFSERIQRKPQETPVNVADLDYVMKITAIASCEGEFIGNRTKCTEFKE